MTINGKRAVAYFDILGFKNKLLNTPIAELSKDYERLISYTDGEFTLTQGKITQRKVCHRYLFSDSLFMIAQEDSEDSFIDLITYAWRTMQQFMVFGFPLRGAVTYGELYANFENNIFLGKAISEAVELESRQNWIGAIVDNSAIKQYESVLHSDNTLGIIMNCLLPIYNVPFKDGTRQNNNVINWRVNLVVEDGIKSLFKNDPYEDSVQEKIDNTLQFSKEVVDLRFAYLNDYVIPERYRTLFAGHKAPSGGGPLFSNGDEY